jgi:Domain of unknown function (DUF4158)
VRHRALILEFYAFRPFNSQSCPLLIGEITRLVQFQIKPKLILWRCVDALIREKIEVPSYMGLCQGDLGAVRTSCVPISRTM